MGQKKQTKFILGKREFGKILMCLIIAIIMLTSLRAIATTIISGSSGVIENEKTILRTASAVSRGASSNNKVELASLTTELGRYASTTVTQISSEILQVRFNRTGNIYDINVNSGPTFDAQGTKPYLPAGYTPVENTELETGFVIEDKNGNQFVWIEVPKTSTVYPTAGVNITTFTSAAYDKIEADLHTYTSTYRAETTFSDTWYSDTGLTQTEYNTLKKKMLKSIYKNGGFYIGRYETGIADSQPDVIDTTIEARTAAGETTQTPVIQANAYPYVFATCSQAQELAESFKSAGYETSLLFGVQWDLVMKFLEKSGAVTESELMVNSVNLGNYRDNVWSVTNSAAKHVSINLSTGVISSWIDGTYSKTAAAENEKVLLSTGAHSDWYHMGISDIAGNVCEWTLEYSSISDTNSVMRDGYFGNTGTVYPSNRRTEWWPQRSNYDTGFRVALYKDENTEIDQYARYYNASNLDGNGTTGVATTTIADLAGNYDGIINGGTPTFGDGYISFNEGSPANAQYIDIGPTHDLDKLTINMKISIDKYPVSNVINLIGNWEVGGFGLGIDTSNRLFFNLYPESGTAYSIVRYNNVELNTIYDVTAVYDGTNMYLYVNGTLAGSTETAGGRIKNPANGEHTLIGANPYNSGIGALVPETFKIYSTSIRTDVKHP